MKKALKIIISILLAVLLVALAYVAYVFIAYHRLPDEMDLEVKGRTSMDFQPAHDYSIVSWNIGFGAYESDYGFFMDGGTQSWAWSEDRLKTNLGRIQAKLSEQDADIYLIQEVDFDATRSYHVDEREYLTETLGGDANYTFAQNYDSPFLFYPFTQPHGASKAGIMTFSRSEINSAQRISLPIENGFTKFLDLDRCYSRNFISLGAGQFLVLYNLHLSAYTTDGTIATEQLKLLLADMEEQYSMGNYCIAGGDFNKDLLGDSAVYFGASDKEYSWAQPIPEDTFDGYHTSLVAPLDKDHPIASCRNADGPYHEGQYVLTVDGFMVTDNVEVISSEVIDYQFEYSDHNPVRMTFSLN
ncbi:MAG: endonuclease/exonuclease/phosphatase family protein [Firmicutes bacterium]|nr:endonuclease/exonuclease/phosphatase family protein [Bacillota bacterium]